MAYGGFWHSKKGKDMGKHAGEVSNRHGRYRGLHSDLPIFGIDSSTAVPPVEAEEESGSFTRRSPRAWTAAALAAVVVAVLAGSGYVVSNQTDKSRKTLSAPTYGQSGAGASSRPGVRPTVSTPLSMAPAGAQPAPTATVTLPGIQQTVKATATVRAPQASPEASPMPGPTETVYRHVAGPTVTKTVITPGPTQTVWVRSPKIRVTVTVTVPVVIPS